MLGSTFERGSLAHLVQVFDRVNAQHFDGFLDRPQLRWNTRLRTSAGRFRPGIRKYIELRPPLIEIATYLLEEAEAEALVLDTIAHEMIHYWLWVRRRPCGHTPEFMAKMRQMGVSRYNTVPRRRPYKYVYRCPACTRDFKTRRKLGSLACRACCDLHAGGRFDARFRLQLEGPV